MRKRRPNPLIERVRITDLAAEGKAMAKVDGKVLFVPFVAPGDLVDVQVTKKRKSYMEGYVTAYHELSADRVEPFCAHFGLCGGCKWQHIPYSLQLKSKQQQVEDQFKRIGKLQIPTVSTIIGSDRTQFYRNKLEFTFSHNRWITTQEFESGNEIQQHPVLGFHVPGRFDKVFNVDKCFLQDDPSNAIRNAVVNFAREKDLSFYNIRENSGFLRNLIIRTSSIGEVMVILSVSEHDMPYIEAVLNHVKEQFPNITSLMYVVNPKLNDTIIDIDVVTYSGRDYIVEEMEGLQFKIGPKSFFQTNSLQAFELYKVAREFASLEGDELVYDLYTGTGSIALFLAKSCKKVIGIEYVPEAIADANENAALNGIENTFFVAGDMKRVLTPEFVEEHGSPDVVVLDPPRAGVHPDVIKSLQEIKPKRIVYVSCNPATQARDIQLLGKEYKIVKIQPVDMFPHTHHVENVALLQRINS